jgi:hypothetical protein
MSEVVSMVSAHIAPERTEDVIEEFGAALRAGMPEHRHTSLLRGGGGLMRIVTIWRSRHDLDRYLAGVDKPAGSARHHRFASRQAINRSTVLKS